ncbi:dehydrogenase [Mycena sp. CBHHK59/15]|nr:dehydrogenase [Mycena sp. CBHHK59/15]
MAPAKHLAAVIVEGGNVEVKEVDVPKVGENEVLVKVVAAALNPTDWKTAKNSTKPGVVSGCDFAGIVEQLGPGAAVAGRTVGERVSTMVPGGRTANGAYAQYVVALAGACMSIPESWTLEQAAQLPIGVYTACQCLYQSLALPHPPAATTAPLLIYGASSAVGLYTIQLAKLSGMTVYAVCSPKNFALVTSFGADATFDYRDPAVSEKIHAASGGAIRYAVDTISELGSAAIVGAAMSTEGGKIACILSYKDEDKAVLPANVEPIFSLAYDLISDRPNAPSRLALAPVYAKLVTELLGAGKLVPTPIMVMPNGLASVNDGFAYMMEGKVSGQKIIYRIADTPGLA